jgi:N-acyl-D-amino-acid deacylase
MTDLVIRGGTVIDGRGGDPFEADVAMPARLPPSAKSRIVASGEFKARGLLVTPGFVDPHTHYDSQVEQSHHF